MKLIHLLRPVVFLSVLLLAAPGVQAETADERAVARELAKALTRATGELGNVTLASAVPALAGPNAELAVSEVDFDPRSRRFTAMVASGGEKMQVAGRFVVVQRVPVLRQRAAAGDEIRAGDVQWIEMETARMSGDIIDSAGDVVGMAAKRDLMAGQPIRGRDLTRPVMVAKGAMVTMVFRSQFMSLTATGRAIEGGGRGDVIPVMNLQSKKTVYATITGPNQAMVGAGGVPVAAN